MSLSALIRAMTDAGATPEAIALAVEAIEERDSKDTDRKAKRAEQKRREREKNAATRARQSRDGEATSCDKGATEPSQVSPKEISNPLPSHPSSSLRSDEPRARADAFARFWAVWPNKVGKPKAEAAFRKVWRQADEIIAGVEAYVASKPVDRQWLNPATFLNQQRWTDKPAEVLPFAQPVKRERDLRNVPDALLSNDEFYRKRIQQEKWG